MRNREKGRREEGGGWREREGREGREERKEIERQILDSDRGR